MDVTTCQLVVQFLQSCKEAELCGQRCAHVVIKEIDRAQLSQKPDLGGDGALQTVSLQHAEAIRTGKRETLTDQ